MTVLYDRIGVGYAGQRQPDQRIARLIHDALGDARRVLNVGAGAGAYEPVGRDVTAVEPSAEMIAQRPAGTARVIQGNAEDLPFDDNTFDAAMAVLTVHHWTDVAAGLRQMRRVTCGPVVILTFDPAGPYFWLADYLPQIIELDQPIMPKLHIYREVLGDVEVSPVPVPHDCADGFLGAYWRRPEAYLDANVRGAISTFTKLGDISEALKRLEDDLQSGVWARRYDNLLAHETLDIGYRLVVARGTGAS